MSCEKVNCVDEVCSCPQIDIVIAEYCFDDSDSSCFTANQLDNFRFYSYDLATADTLVTGTLARKDVNQTNKAEFNLTLLTEEAYGNFNSANYYIINPEINYLDSLTEFKFEYVLYDCNESGRVTSCHSYSCMDIDLKSIAFLWNGESVVYEDLPLQIRNWRE